MNKRWIHQMVSGVVLGVLCVLFFVPGIVTAAEQTIRVARTDVPATDDLPLQAVWARLQEKGWPIEVIYFHKDDLSHQAVLSGQCQIGTGSPYAIIQNLSKEGNEFRMLVQRRILEYVPVARRSKYESWEDLDGEGIAVHARASGTEAQAWMIEELYGIKFSNITYVPGTEVRGVAMLRGTLNCTFLGLTTVEWLMQQAPGEFIVLPMGGIAATDSAMYANMEWINENEEFVRAMIEELLTVNRRVTADPSYAREVREQYNLMPDAPAELEADIDFYYPVMARRGLRAINGGGEEAAKTDLLFYTMAGQLEGPVEEKKVEDFWYLKPLNDVLDKIGRVTITWEAE